MARSKGLTDEQKAVRDKLRAMLPPGSTVNVMLRHVARSGMMRCISAIVCQDGHPVDISHLIASAGLGKFSQKHGGIEMGGCGMDMGFALVYNLSSGLYPDGFGCTGKGCYSNDHTNGDRDYTPHTEPADEQERNERIIAGTKGHWHTSGGYALCKSWM